MWILLLYHLQTRDSTRVLRYQLMEQWFILLKEAKMRNIISHSKWAIHNN